MKNFISIKLIIGIVLMISISSCSIWSTVSNSDKDYLGEVVAVQQISKNQFNLTVSTGDIYLYKNCEDCAKSLYENNSFPKRGYHLFRYQSELILRAD